MQAISVFPDWLKARYSELKEFKFTSPPGVPEEACGDLNTLIGPYQGGIFDGGPVIRSYWQPSEEEIEALKNGGYIELAIFNNILSPIALNVEVQ